MKRIFLSCIIAIAAVAYANAQQISVVSPSGTTTLYTDLNLAIQGAQAGSTVYLSGGGLVSDTTKIKKKLTIIGLGHRPDNDKNNADGNTDVSGNLWFEGGSDGSAVMGLYLSGDVNIGTSTDDVNNFLLRYCNVNSVQVGNSNCQEIRINQNYLRNTSSGGNSPIQFTNNIMHSAGWINGGKLIGNVVISNYYNNYEYQLQSVQIVNNIFKDRGNTSNGSGNNVVSNNMSNLYWGNNCIVPDNWEDVFIGPDNGVNPSSNFQLKDGAWKTGATDGGEIGIYGGETKFSNTALPPGPRIVRKKIADQTDENGNLRVEIEIQVGSSVGGGGGSW